MAKPPRQKDCFSKQQLHDRQLRAFTGEALKTISMPLGGIGTGCVGLGGRGELRDWEIFGTPNMGFVPPYTLPMIHCRRGKHKVTRVLERRLLPPHVASHGLEPLNLSGLPRLSEAVFVGTYPFGRIDFEDDALPVKVSLEAFNPLIPGDPLASAIPAATLTYTVSNPGKERVQGAIAWSLTNVIGIRNGDEYAWNGCERIKGATNQFRRQKDCRGIFMTNPALDGDDLRAGTMALMTDANNASVATGWLEGGWWDRAQKIWDDFADDGKLDGPRTETPPDDTGRGVTATLSAGYDLSGGEDAQITFVIAWCFPNQQSVKMTDEHDNKPVRKHYATQYKDAWAAGKHMLRNLEDLRDRSRGYERALFGSDLPGHVLEAVSTQACILKTNTVMWLDTPADSDMGRVYAFEGCSDRDGCCPMNCTHVWNYEQTLAHLFPSLEATMRQTDYGQNVHDDGAMAFRTMLPIAPGQGLWGPKLPAADGQFGTLVKLYRDWQLSGDIEMLRELFPAAKESIDFAQQGFAQWDADGDGVLEGVQHNTYDIDFHGPNTMTGSLYLAALKAGAEMAHAVGDDDSAERWDELAASAAKKYDKLLFKRGYFIQKVPHYKKPMTDQLSGQVFKKGRPKYQHGHGCLSDQLLGQWAAHVAGLGYVLPKAHVRQAIKSIFRHNFRADLSDHESVQRTYALNDEAGLLLCTWPKGKRETFPFPYSDEVWTGIEYQVAAGLIYEGLIDEGLTLVKAIRQRHDGYRRNPFDEPECGHYYARALASWSVLLALSGQRYSAVDRSLRFVPAEKGRPFECMVTLGAAYGSARLEGDARRLSFTLQLTEGQAHLAEVVIPTVTGKSKLQLSAKLGQKKLSAGTRRAAGGVKVVLNEPITLTPGEKLKIELKA